MIHTDMQIMKTIDVFKDLLPRELEKVIPLLHPLKIKEGEEFIRRGEPSQTFYVVISGNYMVYFPSGRAFTLHYKGDIVGWTTLVTPFRYIGNVVALTDGEVLTLSRQDFLMLIQEHAVLGGKIMKKINTIMEQRLPFSK